jgi:hypothetical protein
MEMNSFGQSLYVSFNQLISRYLTSSLSSEIYSALCKISATRLLLNNQTRSIDLSSYQIIFINR